MPNSHVGLLVPFGKLAATPKKDIAALLTN
jgi:hypothetical protein